MSEISQQQIEDAQRQINGLVANIETGFIGQKDVVRQVIIALLANGHVLLEGVPGLGKTLLVKLLAKSISVDYKRVQFTPDLMPADVTGHSMINMKSGEFVIKKGPVFTNFLLADEINRAPAKTQAALLEVMQEKQVTIDGTSHTVDAPFMVLATQNPIDNEGTYPLPEAELDRFMMKVLIDYPEQLDEVTLTQLMTANSLNGLSDVTPVMSQHDLFNIQNVISSVVTDTKITEYAVNIVRNTRQWEGIAHGAGVRASIALVHAAKVNALIEGMGFVTPDHIKQVMPCILRHRIILSAEQEIAGASIDEVLLEACNTVEVPRQ